MQRVGKSPSRRRLVSLKRLGWIAVIGLCTLVGVSLTLPNSLWSTAISTSAPGTDFWAFWKTDAPVTSRQMPAVESAKPQQNRETVRLADIFFPGGTRSAERAVQPTRDESAAMSSSIALVGYEEGAEENTEESTRRSHKLLKGSRIRSLFSRSGPLRRQAANQSAVDPFLQMDAFNDGDQPAATPEQVSEETDEQLERLRDSFSAATETGSAPIGDSLQNEGLRLRVELLMDQAKAYREHGDLEEARRKARIAWAISQKACVVYHPNEMSPGELLRELEVEQSQRKVAEPRRQTIPLFATLAETKQQDAEPATTAPPATPAGPAELPQNIQPTEGTESSSLTDETARLLAAMQTKADRPTVEQRHESHPIPLWQDDQPRVCSNVGLSVEVPPSGSFVDDSPSFPVLIPASAEQVETRSSAEADKQPTAVVEEDTKPINLDNLPWEVPADFAELTDRELQIEGPSIFTHWRQSPLIWSWRVIIVLLIAAGCWAISTRHRDMADIVAETKYAAADVTESRASDAADASVADRPAIPFAPSDHAPPSKVA